MSRWRLILRSLAHYRALHIGALLGVALGSAVLTGALLVSDSVRLSLREQALLRIGQSDLALSSGERLFRDALADELADELEGVRCAPALWLRGVASAAGGSRRALDVGILGVDRRFFELAPAETPLQPPAEGELYLNERLARRLGAAVGERVVLRVDSPTPMPREAVLGGGAEAVQPLALGVGRIVADAEFGRFGLVSTQLPPLIAFVSLDLLQARLGLEERANLALLGGRGPELLPAAREALSRRFTLADAGLSVRELTTSPQLELISDRILFDPAISAALARAEQPAMGVFTYLVNELRLGSRSVPYSLVAGLGPIGAPGAQPEPVPWRGLLPEGTATDEIVINTWLAQDLGAAPGDVLELDYSRLGVSRALDQETSALRIRTIVPLEGLAADRELMPPFPGIAGSDTCRDWDVDLPIDLSRIRERDEEWWRQHEGTPKAFVPLAAGAAMWGSERFGALTALRFERENEEALLAGLRGALDPEALGLALRDVRTPALAGSSPATDFGGLLLGLSFFLLVSAYLLVGLLLALGVLQRSRELGTLLSLGFRPAVLRRLLLGEAALLSALGAALGVGLGAGYALLVIELLGGIWSDAVAGSALDCHLRAPVLLAGGASAWLVALASAWLTLRRQAQRPAVELLALRGGIESDRSSSRDRRRRASAWVASTSLLAALAAAVLCIQSEGPARPAISFSAGTLALIAALAAGRWAVLGADRRKALAFQTPLALAWSNAIRRPARSLAAIVLLACGSFLILVVGAHRKLPPKDVSVRASGTGGFALVGRSTLAVVPPRRTEQDAERFLLAEDQPTSVEVVPLRVRDGDEASCLNLGRPQQPRLVGLRPEDLARRGAFVFADSLTAEAENPWLLLSDDEDPDRIPAIGDEASLTWSLHLGLGDRLEYFDERGRPFELEIVGALSGSILQGDLLIDERRFQERFPSETGHRAFLVDAPPDRAPELAAGLMTSLADVGLELHPTAERLAELGAVQNTYLVVFQVLGGLGLLLGSVGLGVIVLRNVAERRSELATLTALGFPASRVRGLLLREHALLLLAGLASGILGALFAIVPLHWGRAAAIEPEPALVLLAVMLAGGFAWVLLAARIALRRPALEALGRAD